MLCRHTETDNYVVTAWCLFDITTSSCNGGRFEAGAIEVVYDSVGASFEQAVAALLAMSTDPGASTASSAAAADSTGVRTGKLSSCCGPLHAIDWGSAIPSSWQPCFQHTLCRALPLEPAAD